MFLMPRNTGSTARRFESKSFLFDEFLFGVQVLRLEMGGRSCAALCDPLAKGTLSLMQVLQNESWSGWTTISGFLFFSSIYMVSLMSNSSVHTSISLPGFADFAFYKNHVVMWLVLWLSVVHETPIASIQDASTH
jgi:hypothetical protein